MIKIQLNRRDFEYDIYSLVKAFYPGSEVITDYPGKEPSKEKKTSPAFQEAAASFTELEISVFYEENMVRVALRDGEAPGANHTPEDQETLCAPVADWWDRLQAKSVVKGLLYRLLRERTRRDLPWGDLTGIRPARIVMNHLRAGEQREDIARFLQSSYFVSPQKADLAIRVATREQGLLEQIDYRNGYSLYVGIPFCPSICLYCSFSSSPLHLWKDQVDTYLDALFLEMEECARLFAGKKLQTVYIGGGTPTTLTGEQMDRLLEKIKTTFPMDHVREFTVEAGRPDSITPEKLQVLRDHSIDRISINPQTMNQKTLDVIGRQHTVEQIRECHGWARSLGFDNINMDLIIGLPGEGPAQVARTMEAIDALAPESVTVHALALKRAARLNLMRDQYQEISFQASAEVMDLTMEHCMQRGLSPYYMYRQKNIAGNFENVGYALPGRECLYNVLIMEEVQSILALGAGGSTKLVYGNGRIERVENVKDIRQYIQRIPEMIARKQTAVTSWENEMQGQVKGQ